jgi:hypothetical protein
MPLLAFYIALVGVSCSFLVLGGGLTMTDYIGTGLVFITLGAGWLAILFGGVLRLLMACRPPLEYDTPDEDEDEDNAA